MNLIAKVKPDGVYASVVDMPKNAATYPSVKMEPGFSKFDRGPLEFMAEAVRDGKLIIPISQKMPLRRRQRLKPRPKKMARERFCWWFKLAAN